MPDPTFSNTALPSPRHRFGLAVAASTSLHVLMAVYLYMLADGRPTHNTPVLQVRMVKLPVPAPQLQMPDPAPPEDPSRQHALLTENSEFDGHQASKITPRPDDPQTSELTPESTEPSKSPGDWPLPRNIAIQFEIINQDNSESLGTYLQTFDAETSGAYRIRLEPLSSAEGVKHWQISILGNIGPDGLAPENYEYQGGFTQRLMANTPLDTGTLNASGEHVGQLSTAYLDDASLVYQLMRIARNSATENLATLHGSLPGGFEYQSAGSETLTLTGQEPQTTLRLAVTKPGSSARTELWLATELQFIPLKVLTTDTNGDTTLRIAKTYIVK